MRDLQIAGLVERRAGSGTYVKALGRDAGALSFGLLIPDLGETEIFETRDILLHGTLIVRASCGALQQNAQ